MIMMAEAQGDGNDEIFVYMGGNQQVPRDGVRRARIHESVKIVRARAFQNCRQLITVDFHDGVEIIEEGAFYKCRLLCGSIKLLGVRIVKEKAFEYCCNLTGVEFGDKLETIERGAFYNTALKKIKMPSVRTIGKGAFAWCHTLSDVECGEGMMTLHRGAFRNCRQLKRIALPLKGGMIEDDAFLHCYKLTTVDLLEGVHQTVACLHMESWRSEINIEINRINQTLPPITGQKTAAIQRWMRRVTRQLNHFKAEHNALSKEATTLLELALWKAKLAYSKEDEGEGVRTAGKVESSRDVIRFTSGADVVIKNVLPFLVLKVLE